MSDLRQAARAVIERWDSPSWDWCKQGTTADLIAALRAALEAHDVPEAACGNMAQAEPLNSDLGRSISITAAQNRCAQR